MWKPMVAAVDFLNHTPPDAPRGPEALKLLITWLRGAFPDSHYAIKEVVAEGDHAALYLSFSGTHQGAFKGAPATGRRFSQDQMHFIRLQDGKVAEHWAVRDDLAMMRQLGITDFSRVL
jgi:predicted ester cyclase